VIGWSTVKNSDNVSPNHAMTLEILMIEPLIESMIFRKLFGQPRARRHERLSFQWNEDRQERHGFFKMSDERQTFLHGYPRPSNVLRQSGRFYDLIQKDSSDL
jgi:hypothetical protein